MYQREFVGRTINILCLVDLPIGDRCVQCLGLAPTHSCLGPNRCHALLQNDVMETLSIWDETDLGLILTLTKQCDFAQVY